MKRTIFSRVTALLLAMIMTMGMLPTSALAELLPEAPPEVTTETPGNFPLEKPDAEEDTTVEDGEPVDLLTEPRAGESLTGGVKDYADNAQWLFSEPKSLSLNVSVPTVTAGSEYKVQIRLAQGMRFAAFPWDDAKKVAAIPKEVKGTPIADSAVFALVKSCEIKLDKDKNIILTYVLAPDTTAINLSGKITVEPNGYYTYDQDAIADAVTLSLLNSADAEVQAAAKTQVTVKGTTPTIGNPNITAVADVPTSNLATSCHVDCGTLSANITQKYLKSMVVRFPMPEPVTAVTTPRSGFTGGLDPSTHIATFSATDIEGQGWFQLVLDIKAVAEGKYAAEDKITAELTMYDGTQLTVTSAQPTQLSANASSTQLTVAEYSSRSQNPPYPEAVADIQHLTWRTNNQLTADQIVSYDFTNADHPTQVADMVMVVFPNQTAKALTDVNITFDDDTFLHVDSIPSAGVANIIEVSIGLLKEMGYDITGKYIRTISANCGTFATKFGAGVRGVGRYSQGVVDAWKSGSLKVPYTVSVNGIKTAVYLTYQNTDHNSMHADISNVVTVPAGQNAEIKLAMDTVNATSGYTKEPVTYIVERDGFTLDTTSIVVSEGTSPFTPMKILPKEQVVIEPITVTDAAKKTYNAYKIYVKDYELSPYTNEGQRKLPYLQVTFNLHISEDMSTGQYSISDKIFCAGPKLEKQTAYATSLDIYDLNGNGNYTEVITAMNPSAPKISVTESKNLYLKQWMTTPGSTVEAPAYNPGTDGTTNTNAVPFAPGASADLRVQIKNTNDTAQGDTIRAYIPIPKATITGSTVTPQNIKDSNGATDARYQFGDFKWGMNLKSLVQSPSTVIYDIAYYTGVITTDTSGVPTNTPTWTNPGSLTDDELKSVTMVGISVKQGQSIPLQKPGGGAYVADFVVPLTVGVTEAEANTADLNGKKNIFRPWFYRSSTSGAGYTNGTYAAPLLSRL